MKRSLIKALVTLVSLALVLTGCWDQRSISKRAILVGIGLSASHQWTFVFPNVTTTVSSLSSIDPSREFYGLQASASSWTEALARVQRMANREVYPGDLEELVVSRDLSRSAVAAMVETLNNEGMVPASTWIAASTVTPQKILLMTSPQSVVPTVFLPSYFSCTNCHAALLGVHAWQWWDRNGTPGVSPIVPLVVPRTNGLSVSQLLVYPTVGVPKLMPRTATEGYEYLMGHVRKGAIAVKVKGVTYTVSGIQAHVRTRVGLTDHAVTAIIKITASGTIAEVPANSEVTRTTEKAVGRAMAHVILKRCLSSLAWSNQTHTDPFGYAKNAAWKHSRIAQRIEPNQLSALPIHAVVSVRGHITGEGVAE